jgi:hypothetical protein
VHNPNDHRRIAVFGINDQIGEPCQRQKPVGSAREVAAGYSDLRVTSDALRGTIYSIEESLRSGGITLCDPLHRRQ